MMKTATIIVGLVLLSLSAQAQDLDRPQLRLKPLNHKLELDYIGKDSSQSKLHPLQKPCNRYSLFPKTSPKSADITKGSEPKFTMPVVVPDANIQFHILALKPDSTIAFPMPVKKP